MYNIHKNTRTEQLFSQRFLPRSAFSILKLASTWTAVLQVKASLVQDVLRRNCELQLRAGSYGQFHRSWRREFGPAWCALRALFGSGGGGRQGGRTVRKRTTVYIRKRFVVGEKYLEEFCVVVDAWKRRYMCVCRGKKILPLLFGFFC